jgi:hypothetical protein
MTVARRIQLNSRQNARLLLDLYQSLSHTTQKIASLATFLLFSTCYSPTAHHTAEILYHI